MEAETTIDQKPKQGAHVLVLPLPTQGHINPMLQFSKQLASKGLKVSFVTTTSTPKMSPSETTVEFIRIFDGFKEGEETHDIDYRIKCSTACLSHGFTELMDHYDQNKANLNPTPKMVIYDAVMPWVLDVVRKRGIGGTPFFTQSCTVNSINYHVYKGTLTTLASDGSLVSLPGIKGLLHANDLPSFCTSPGIYPSVARIVADQFLNYGEAEIMLINTVDKLEIEVVNWTASQWPVKTIGPTIPSKYLNKRLPEDKDYGLSLFKPETGICIQWLDSKEVASVVYVAMGSLASLGEEQMEEMAIGLERCTKYFLWVVRASEENKLPTNFKERTSEKGLIVNWCTQLEVLAHPAVGCFVNHCGWNSTLEAITLGVPMVAFPQWTDQPTNAKCIADFWRVGIRVKANDKGIVTAEEIKCCIQQVMEGETGKEIRSNAIKWKQVVKEAVNEGGSSHKNIEEFVAKLLGS